MISVSQVISSYFGKAQSSYWLLRQSCTHSSYAGYLQTVSIAKVEKTYHSAHAIRSTTHTECKLLPAASNSNCFSAKLLQNHYATDQGSSSEWYLQVKIPELA